MGVPQAGRGVARVILQLKAWQERATKKGLLEADWASRGELRGQGAGHAGARSGSWLLHQPPVAG